MDGEGLLFIWDTADGSSLVQVLGTKFVVLQQRLAGGEIESTAGAGKMGTTGEVSYTQIVCPTGGTQSGAPDISNVLTQVREEDTEAGCY